MSEVTWLIIICVGACAGYLIGYRWWRNRRAAKLADNLLAEIVKGKDAFRR